MVYLIGGIAGMRKSSFIVPKILAKRKVIITVSTDFIRLITSYLLLNEPAATGHLGGPIVIQGKTQFKKDGVETPNDLGKALGSLEGEDDLAWIGAVGIIKRCHTLGNLVIEGVAIKPRRVRALQDSEPEIKIKAAFIGHSKNMNCSDSKMNLYGHQKLGYTEVPNSKVLEEEFNSATPHNSKYFDFIDCIPSDRKNVDDIEIWKEDFDENSNKIASFLLND